MNLAKRASLLAWLRSPRGLPRGISGPRGQAGKQTEKGGGNQTQPNFAEEIGLDMNEWTECMIQQKHSQTILNSNDDAKALELTGTPAFFVINSDGGVTKLTGAQPFEVFKRTFDNELEK